MLVNKLLASDLTLYWKSIERNRSIDIANVSIDFSVIIPTFRRPRELVEAISSVLRQQGSTVEIFVIDDSPEGSAEEGIRGLRDSRIVYVKNPNPTGGVPSVVRNIGWPMARGAFIHFLDDDDIVAEGYYAAIKAAFAEDPSIGLVFGRIEPFGSGPVAQLNHERQYFVDAARKSVLSDRFGRRFAFTGRMLFDKALLVCSASVTRRECVARLGGFDPSIRLMEDADFHVRAMRECGALFLDRTAIHYRVGSPSLMHSPHITEEQKQGERVGHRQMQAKYRRDRGTLEFYALALFTRTVLKLF
jgi:GT2 family glycosyltransferase